MKVYNHNLQLSAAVAFALVLGLYVYSNDVQAAEVQDFSKINGNIHIASEQRAGDVSTVNGHIRVSADATAREVNTVNGPIELHRGVIIAEAGTVNGSITGQRGVTINGSVCTVNGSIRLQQDSVVHSEVCSVNGGIHLAGTHVKDNVETSYGDVYLSQGTLVEGDIIFNQHKQRWWHRLFSSSRRHPELNIDASSQVNGDIHLYSEVDLQIHDDASVGDIVRHY